MEDIGYPRGLKLYSFAYGGYRISKESEIFKNRFIQGVWKNLDMDIQAVPKIFQLDIQR